jgi:Cysteine rich repeat
MSSLRCALAVLLIAAPLSALAQGTPQQRAACRADVGKFCKGKGEDPGVLLTCLEDNKDKISEKCRKVIVENDDKATPASAEKKDEAKPAETPANSEKKDEKK